MIACFGDSITEGHPGVTYLRYVQTGQFQNHGLGGDTVAGLTKRLEEFRKTNTCDGLVIEIGTNDIILPVLQGFSPKWGREIQNIIDRGSVPAPNTLDFRSAYEKLITLAAGENTIVINIPLLGEMPESELNRKADEYNLIINEICSRHGIRMVDFNRWQKGIVKNLPARSAYFISEEHPKILMDTFLTRSPGLSDWLSRRRKLALTIDGVHLNTAGAKGLAELIRTAL